MLQRGRARARLPWSIGTFAFLANRVAGVALALYLVTHITLLGAAARNRSGFDGLMQKLHSPFWLTLEMLLLLAVIFHAANGIRLVLIDAGVQPRKQKQMFWWAVGGTAAVFAVAAIICVPVIIRHL
jgi:succinate dehydrogenase / fumarate reductase cytochrome b subunit